MDMPAPAAAAPESAAPEAPVAPPPPAEGYSERAVKDLAKALGVALKAFMSALGKKGAPEVPEPGKELFEKGKMMAPLPAFVVQEVMMILGAAAQLGGKVEGRYDVDVMPMFESDDGIEKITDLLTMAAKDKVLLAAIKEQVKGGALSRSEEKAAMAEGKKEAKYGDKDSPEHEAAESPAYEAAEEKGAAMSDYA